jgi:hypothetical protein
MERIMTKVQALVLSTALAIGMVAPASAGVNDPEVIIYRFPGVRDNAAADKTGVATVFSCANFSGEQPQLRFVPRSEAGTLILNFTYTINHLQTRIISTRQTNAYPQGSFWGTGSEVFGGTTAIAATSTNIICTAMAIDAGTVAPVGVALRGIRFNPIPGSQE